jgi:ABC-2 type transport system ATP-binding protein
MADSLMIEAEGLTKRYGSVQALSGLDISVAKGSILAVLGPNGAGKTTAVRILTTRTVPDAGHARVAGHDVRTQSAQVRKCIGVTAQDVTLDGLLTGLQNLVMIGQLSGLKRGAARLRANELLEQFNLTDAGGRVAKGYSGGMRRRLDLAAALVDRPPVLFLDEPTTGLDPYSRVALWAVIGELTTAGATVLLTTQYLEEADRLADRLAVVDHGKVIAEGTSEELKASLGATVLDLNMGDPDRAKQALEVLSARWPREPVLAGVTVELQLDGGARMVTEALGLLDEADLVPTTLAMREPSLDDVFLALTGHGAEAEEKGVRK